MDITVVIPTYNRYSLLRHALRSVYAQTLQPKEVIVIDDGSNDNTSEIVNEFKNIIYVYQPNKGVSAARNAGIQKASSKWIAFLDSDDEWLKEKLQEQVDLHTQRDVLVSYTAERWLRNKQEVKIPKKFRKIGKDPFLENLSYCNIAPSSVMIHKSVLKDVGVFDESLEVCEDYDLWLRIALKYEIALINKALVNKHAGHDEQLGFRKNLEKFRIKSLEKLLCNIDDAEKKLLVEKELEEKMIFQNRK